VKLVSRRSFLIVPPVAAVAAWLSVAEEGVEALDARALEGAQHASGAPVKGFRHSQLRGFVSVVHALASWSPECEAEYEVIRELATHERIQIAGVFVRDDEASARAFIARNGNPYDALAFDGDGRVERLLGVGAPPNTFVFDASGRIVHVVREALTRDYLRGTLAPLVEALSPMNNLTAGAPRPLA
jgi:cytochrome c biogenesis protein CcmG/thiol:disulfide interchange protein DsbE